MADAKYWSRRSRQPATKARSDVLIICGMRAKPAAIRVVNIDFGYDTVNPIPQIYPMRGPSDRVATVWQRARNFPRPHKRVLPSGSWLEA